MPTGTIIKGIGGFYYVNVNERIFECKARGIFRKGDLSPLPGDRVSIDIVDEDKSIGSIVEVMPRSTYLIRPNVANVDQVAVVFALKSPPPDFILLDKLLITADMNNISPLICINKIDLGEEGEYKSIMSSYTVTGYPVLALSSKENIGFENLYEHLKGKITVFAGQSGVGKSTILNTILNSTVMETGEVSRKIERGRHTTRHAELFGLESGGYVVDTPGFSSFELMDISHDKLELYYPEFNNYINKCKFTGCSHISEPECRVKEALEDGSIDKGRYSRYIELYGLLRQEKSYGKKRR